MSLIRKKEEEDCITIEFSELEVDGSFRCPKCRTMISPDDFSNNRYAIIDYDEDFDQGIKEVVLVCFGCGSKIKLVNKEVK